MVCIYHILLEHSSPDGYFSYFYLLAILKNATMSTGVERQTFKAVHQCKIS